MAKMDEMVRTGGEATVVIDDSVPPVASTYFHAVLSPAHRDMGLRNSREARTLCRALDLLAKREAGAAADVLCQRLKALEKAVKDNNSWVRAQWLELLPPEGMTLVDRDEELMTTCEEALQAKITGNKGKGHPSGKDGESKGKGKGKKK